MAAQADCCRQRPLGRQCRRHSGGKGIAGTVGVSHGSLALGGQETAPWTDLPAPGAFGANHQGGGWIEITVAIGFGWIKGATNQGIELHPRLLQHTKAGAGRRCQHLGAPRLSQGCCIGRRHEDPVAIGQHLPWQGIAAMGRQPLPDHRDRALAITINEGDGLAGRGLPPSHMQLQAHSGQFPGRLFADCIAPQGCEKPHLLARESR